MSRFPLATMSCGAARLVRRMAGAIAFAVATLGAIAQQEGTVKWPFFTGGPVYSSPALAADGTIYVGNEGNLGGRLLAARPTGLTRWWFTATDWIDATPALSSNGVVYAGSWDGRLYALNASTGAVLWWFSTAGFIASSPALGADGTIYFGGGDSSIYALNPDGTLKWSYLVSDWVDSSPAIGPDGTIYVGCWDNSVYALRPDGTLRWRFETGNIVASSPAIGADGTVFIGSNDGRLYALNGATGAKRWEYATGGGIGASPIVGLNGRVYVGSSDGFFYALNAADGALAWRLFTGDEIFSTAVQRADGVLIFGAGYSVLALNSDGSQRWRLETGDYVDSSPVIAPDGTIYIGSMDRKLYAINGNGVGPATSAPWPMFRRDPLRQGRAPAGTLVTPAVITLGALSATYDGAPKPVTVSTSPAGVAVSVSYNGSTQAPTAAGTYAVSAVVSDPAYEGSAAGTLVIARASQTIAFALADQPFSFTPITLTAAASSGLPVTFSVVAGPAQVSGNLLSFTAAGSVTVRAAQDGDANHLPAPVEERTILVGANFDAWRAENFSESQLAAGLGDADACPAGDGWSNLLKYALGVAPNAAMTTAWPEASVSAGEWVFAFSRPVGLTDVTYAVESSTDLIAWTGIGFAVESLDAIAGREHCVARVPFTSGVARFFRLRVTR